MILIILSWSACGYLVEQVLSYRLLSLDEEISSLEILEFAVAELKDHQEEHLDGRHQEYYPVGPFLLQQHELDLAPKYHTDQSLTDPVQGYTADHHKCVEDLDSRTHAEYLSIDNHNNNTEEHGPTEMKITRSS